MRKISPEQKAANRREQWRKRKERDPEKELERGRKYRRENREKLVAQHRAWCEQNRDKERAYTKTWREKNKAYRAAYAHQKYIEDPQKTINYQRKRKYGLTDEQIMQVNQTTQCQVCKKELVGRDKHVDHDHKTGRFRGVLCRACNTSAGQLLESPMLAFRLYEYLVSNSVDTPQGAW